MSKPPQPIDKCRVSGSTHLVKVLSLGEQELTGVFPRARDEKITSGPLELVWCPDSGLLQLSHSYDSAEMYGQNYGYRSGLNQSMVRHLQPRRTTWSVFTRRALRIPFSTSAATTRRC